MRWCVWPTEPGQCRRCDHHPQQRPPTRATATDWVKNGDRWAITDIGRRGDLTVRHTRSQLTAVRLPIDYVRTSTCLGYATTIHNAQGVSADTMHGLLTGQESRQQLYTMLTRGRHANHIYPSGRRRRPHTLIRPDTISARTPSETPKQILGRDEAPVSASTLLRELNNPAARLFGAVQRYTDGLHVAAEQLLDPRPSQYFDHADQYVPGLTTESAWPTLRAHLLALAAETGEHPLRHMMTAGSVDATFEPRATWPPCSIGASQSWRLPTQVRCPGSRAFQKRCMPIRSGNLSGQAIPTGRRPRRPGPRSRLPRRRPASLGTTGESPQHRPHRRNCSVAGRQRHQFPGPATNRRKPTRNASGTVETTPRSGCRACHRPASRCKGRRATGSTRHVPDVCRTTASAPTKDPNGVRAGCPRPADSTPRSQIAALGT